MIPAIRMPARWIAAGLLAVLSASHVAAETPLGKMLLLRPSAPPAPGAFLYYYAKEMGFYEREGLDVEIRQLATETVALRTLLAGEGDLADTSVTGAVSGINAGAQLKAISSFTPTTSFSLVAHKDIASARDLNGRTVAVAQIGSVSYVVAQLMIEAAGGDPAKINWTVIGNGEQRLQALAAKRVDATLLMSPYVPRAQNYPYLHVVEDSLKVVPQFLLGFDAVRASDIERRRPAYQAYVTATRKAVQFLYANLEHAMAVSEKLMPTIPQDEMIGAIKRYASVRYWSMDGVIPRESWDFTVTTLIAKDTVKSAPSYDDIVMSEFTAGK